MLKKTITYTDFNGDEVSEDFFFHLSKAELVELEMSHEGGMSATLQRIVDAEDGKAIMSEFKNIILSSYGKRSSDGKRFVKNQLLREEFESTEAYSTLFMELLLNTDAAIEFVNGVVPAGLADEVAKLAGADLKVVEEVTVVSPPVEPDPRTAIDPNPEPVVITRAALESMSPQEVAQLGPRIASGEVILGE